MPEKKDSESARDVITLIAAQVKQLYAQSWTGMFGAQASALLLPIALWGVVAWERLAIWLSLYSIIQIPRNLLVWNFKKRKPAEEDMPTWGLWFSVLTIASEWCGALPGSSFSLKRPEPTNFSSLSS